jgi:GR25 family glycosyltransferase involved in LPS biosynthesis
MEGIHGPIVINIAHRVDRLAAFTEEMNTLGLDFRRFDATYNRENGALGCLQSHVGALLSADPDTPTWICEDDCTFLVDRVTLDKVITEFMKSDADILCLGNATRRHVNYTDMLLRTFDTQTTSSYIVKPSLRKGLIDLWQSVVDHILAKTRHPLEATFLQLPVNKGSFYCADMSWKLLQFHHVFVVPKLRCVIQRESYSDIINENVLYGC